VLSRSRACSTGAVAVQHGVGFGVLVQDLRGALHGFLPGATPAVGDHGRCHLVEDRQLLRLYRAGEDQIGLQFEQGFQIRIVQIADHRDVGRQLAF